MLHDIYCKEVCDRDPNKRVAWWIMAAWAYDVTDDPILSDACFDELVRDLDQQWETITHRHKELLDRRALKSALAIGGRYPAIAVRAAKALQDAETSPPPVPTLPVRRTVATETLDLFGGAA